MERISGNVLGTPPGSAASLKGIVNATDQAGDFEFITSNTCLVLDHPERWRPKSPRPIKRLCRWQALRDAIGMTELADRASDDLVTVRALVTRRH
jgi:hypothetical protein